MAALVRNVPVVGAVAVILLCQTAVAEDRQRVALSADAEHVRFHKVLSGSEA
jgi:hypothetical protein